ncbi:DDHD domain-containing protein [Chytriomyces sp. MP71]|nr:DDHD domain-containing protein [Chytriomyces sp. MP71]
MHDSSRLHEGEKWDNIQFEGRETDEEEDEIPDAGSGSGSGSAAGGTPKALIFVVHGMGSQQDKYGTFDKNLDQLRATCAEVVSEDFGSEAGFSYLFNNSSSGPSETPKSPQHQSTPLSPTSPSFSIFGTPTNSSFNVFNASAQPPHPPSYAGIASGEDIAWIPIEWHSIIHSLDSVDARMQLVTLPTTPVFRQINNDMLADVLYYFSAFHGGKIMAIVARVLNEQHAAFMDAYPDFDGPVVVLAHSLGGVISFDLFANQDNARAAKAEAEAVEEEEGARLDASSARKASSSTPPPRTHFEIEYPVVNFTPNLLITLGSQVGAVLVMRGQTVDSYKLPSGILHRNIFHLYDPLAYRLEPLVDSRYAEISPVLLQRPTSLTKGLFNLAYYHSLSQLFSSYLPSLPQDLPNLNLQSMLPNIPILPEFPLPSMPNLANLPNLPDMSMPTFADARRRMMEGVFSLASIGMGFTDLPHGTKRDHERDLDEIGEANGEGEEKGTGSKKRRRINPAPEGAAAEDAHPTRKIAKPRRKPAQAGSTSAATTTSDTPTRAPDKTTNATVSVSSSFFRRTSLSNTLSLPDFTPSPSALAEGVFASIRNAVTRLSTAFTLFDETGESALSPDLTQSPALAATVTVSIAAAKSTEASRVLPPHDHRPSQMELEQAFTEELAAAAERVLKRPARSREEVRQEEAAAAEEKKEKKEKAAAAAAAAAVAEEKPLPLKERLDFFVTEGVMDSTYHQYLIGLRAHFSYWDNKDMMYHILSTIMTLREEKERRGNEN